MAKQMCIGVDNVARKVKAGWIGIDGVARKIKKMWIGIDGIARLFFSSESAPSSGGTATALSKARYYLASTTVGNYALFGGGYTGISDPNSNYGAVNTVDTYNASLTKGTATNLSQARYELAAETIGEYALFAGGYYNSVSYSSSGQTASPSFVSTVDTYNASLTKGTTSKALTAGVSQLASARVGDYALFGGGTLGTTSSQGASANVNAYNASLTKSSKTLGNSRYNLLGASVGSYALFGGGLTQSGSNSFTPTDYVDAFNTSLTRSTPTALSSVRRGRGCGVSFGDYALFASGDQSIATIDAYNASLTRTTPISLSVAKALVSGTVLGNYAIFAGGNAGSASDANNATVDMFDASLTRKVLPNLSLGRYYMSATTIGKNALFAGGQYYSSSYKASDAVDVYKLD